MIITVVSKDKLTLAMFVDFYRTIYDSVVEILDLNLITSSSIIDSIVKSFIGTHLQKAASEDIALLIRLKAKGDMTLERLPLEVQEKSTHIVKFDIYSTQPEVLKSKYPEKLQVILDRWLMNIKKMNGEL